MPIYYADEARARQSPRSPRRLLVRALDELFARVPALRRAFERTEVGRSDAIHRLLAEGRTLDALERALSEMEARRRAPDLASPLGFWHFAKLAAYAAFEHGDVFAEARVLEAVLFDDAPPARGVEAARALLLASRWLFRRGREARAILLAHRARAADESFSEPRVVLAWYGLVSGRFDPLPLLEEVIALDPEALARIISDPAFLGAEDLLAALTRPRAV